MQEATQYQHSNFYQNNDLFSIAFQHQKQQKYQKILNHLQCQRKNLSQLVCCSQSCRQYAPVCSQKQCNCRKQSHRYCQLIFIESLIEKIMTKKTKPSQQVQKSINLIQKIYSDTIQQLSLQRQALLNWKDNYGLSTDDIRFLQILGDDIKQQLSGELIHKIKSNINKKSNLRMTEKQITKIWNQERLNIDQIFARINYSFKPVIRSFKLDNSVVEVKLSNNGNQIQITQQESQLEDSNSNTRSLNQIKKKNNDIQEDQKEEYIFTQKKNMKSSKNKKSSNKRSNGNNSNSSLVRNNHINIQHIHAKTNELRISQNEEVNNIRQLLLMEQSNLYRSQASSKQKNDKNSKRKKNNNIHYNQNNNYHNSKKEK